MRDLSFPRLPLDDPYLQLINHFESVDWPVDPDPEHRIIHLSYKGNEAEYRCVAAILNDPLVVQFFVIIPTAIPTDKLMKIAEFTARANWGLTLGRFEFSFGERQLRFQTAAPLPDGKFNEYTMKRLVVLNIASVEAYFPAIMSIIFADVSPAAAVQKVEMDN